MTTSITTTTISGDLLLDVGDDYRLYDVTVDGPRLIGTYAEVADAWAALDRLETST